MMNDYATEAAIISRDCGTIADIDRAQAIYRAYKAISESDHDKTFQEYCARAAIYRAGYIAGKREERARRRGSAPAPCTIHLNPCANCGTQSGTLHARTNFTEGEYYCKCSRCGAQTIHASYICGDPAQIQRAKAETRAQVLTYWNRGDLI